MSILQVSYFRQSEIGGNFLKWSATEWELTKMESTIVDHDQICRPQSETIMIPGLRDFKSSKHLCKQFRGSIVVIKNKTQSDFLNDLWWKMVGNEVSPYGKVEQLSSMNNHNV